MGVTQVIGQQAEDMARDFLQQHGLRLLHRNYRSRYGEIDLIMQDQDTTVFVEVRYRKDGRYVDAIESIDSRKQHRLIRTAQHYLQQYTNPYLRAARFDVIAIHEQNGQPQLQWLKNAFEA